MYMSYDKIGINKIKGEGEDMNKRIAYYGIAISNLGVIVMKKLK